MPKNSSEHEFQQHDLFHVVADEVNQLPRSILRRTDFELLDGSWRFALDAENSGLTEKWFEHHDFTRTTMFLESIESQFAAAKSDNQESSLCSNRDEVIAWYEREFAVPEDWNRSNKITQLIFGACGYETRVCLCEV